MAFDRAYDSKPPASQPRILPIEGRVAAGCYSPNLVRFTLSHDVASKLFKGPSLARPYVGVFYGTGDDHGCICIRRTDVDMGVLPFKSGRQTAINVRAQFLNCTPPQSIVSLPYWFTQSGELIIDIKPLKESKS